MENNLSMVDGPKTTEITSIDQIDQQTMQEFLAKTSPWDFYEITREEYMNKSDNDKKSLIFSFFNHMMSGKILLFVSLLFGVCSLFLLVHEHIKECSSEAVARRCSVKKVFLEMSQNSQENSCSRVSFLIKLQAWGLF